MVMIKIINADCPFKSTINNQTVTLTNFNNLSQLSFNQCKEPIIVHNWQLKPDEKLILDNTLNLKGLAIITENKFLNCIVNLINFKGFDLLSNPFKDINFIGYLSLKHVIWLIEQSNFEFYLNNKLIKNEKYCNNSNNYWDNLITNSKLYFLMISNSQYSIGTCSYIFKNSQIKSLFFKEIKSSLISTNILTFLKTNDLESFVLQVDFDLYRIYFDDNLFDKMIFRNTKILDINGILIGIQDDLFKSFNEMKLIRIRSQHVRQIFAKNNKWFEYLNFYFRPIDPSGLIESALLKQLVFLKIYQSFPRVTFYDYPNEDFCLFNKFPHNKLVFPQLRPNRHDSNCSCTEIYLIQYSFIYKFASDFYTDQVSIDYRMPQYYTDEIKDRNFSNCIRNKQDLKNFVKKCEFKQRLEKCNIIPYLSENDSYFEMYDWLEARKISNLIFSVYLNNIFSLIIIILNILTLKMLKSKSIVNEKNGMYNFLFINTIFCLIYITICLIKVIGICVDYEFYCSPLIETKFNIYYKTIFVLFIGETIKTASNFSFISFSLSRYIKVTSTKSRLLLKIDKLKKRYYFLNSLIIAIFINLYHLFEYNFNLAKLPEIFNGGLKSIEIFFKYSNPSDEFIHFSTFQFYLLNSFFYIKIIFSDLFYIILNIIIDLKLLSFIKIQLNKKLKLTTTIPMLATATRSDLNNANRSKGQTIANIFMNLKQANSTTNRITFMIILNGLNCFIFRFPIAFANFYGFIFRYEKSDKIFKPNTPSFIVCRRFKFCPSLQEILYFLYLFSLLIQFFIFLKFDKRNTPECIQKIS